MTSSETTTGRLLKAKEGADELGIPLPSWYRLARQGEFDDFEVRIGEKPLLRYRPEGLAEYKARGGLRTREECNAKKEAFAIKVEK